MAYILGGFPFHSETFVLGEMLELMRRGVEIYVFSLTKPREPVVHENAVELIGKTYYSPFLLSWKLLSCQLGFFMRAPWRYLSTWLYLIRHTLSSRRALVGSLAMLPKVVYFSGIIRDLDLEHIHAHTCTFGATAACIASRLTGIPYSFTGHGLELYKYTTMMAEKIEKAAFMVTISEYNRKFLRPFTRDPKKIEVVHCGIDPDHFRPPESGEERGVVRILSVARLERYKGMHVLLEACEKLRAEGGTDFQVIIVGDGPQREKLGEEAADRNLGDAISLPGAIPQEKVVDEYRDSDIFVLPSFVEGIPVVLMEAMACELPVIGTEIYGIPELVEDGVSGFLVPPGDADSLAQVLRELLADPGMRKRFGKMGREKILKEFTIVSSSARLERLFFER